MFKTILIVVFIPFSVLSAQALWQVGYLGLFTQQFSDYGKLQVLVDLLIAVSICMWWMWWDAKKIGRSPWPWLALSLVSGSFGPLLYLITRPSSKTEAAPW